MSSPSLALSRWCSRSLPPTGLLASAASPPVRKSSRQPERVAAVTPSAGYNFGRNPIPNDHLSPLLPSIGEHHLTGGAAWQVGERVRAGFALEYLLPNEVDYGNAPPAPGSSRHSMSG